MRTFIQDMSQYNFHQEWDTITIMKCPKAWWMYAPNPVICAIIDSSLALAYYLCSDEKSSANHQDDGMAALLAATDDDPNSAIRQASIFHRSSTQKRGDGPHMSLFEAARHPYLLTKQQHATLVADRGAFLDAYQAWFNALWNNVGPPVITWHGMA